MTEAHIGSVLPIKNRVLAADEHTAFLAHYDLNEHDILRGVNALGETQSALFDTTWFRASDPRYTIRNNITMAAWVFPTATPSNDRGCLFINQSGYYLTIDTSLRIATHWYGKTSPGYHVSTGTCPLNQWTHVAVVWDDAGAKLYINGVLDKAIASTGAGGGGTVLTIGSEFASSRHFKGKINNLGLWADAKTAGEINSIMSGGASGNEKGLRGFWKMTEGEGVILNDSSPFHQDIIPEPNRSFTWSTGSSIFTLHPEEGKFGGAITVEDSTQNEVTSPDFSSFSGYEGCEMTQVDDSISQTKKALNFKVLINEVNASARVGLSHASSADAGFHSIGFYAKAMNDKAYGKVPRLFTGLSWHGSPEVGQGLTYEYQKYEFHNKEYGTSSGGAAIGLSEIGVEGLEWQIIEPQIEAREFCTSFAYTSRDTGRLVYDLKQMDVDPLGDWTISGWFKRHPSPSGWASAFGIGNYYKEGESEFTVWTNHAGRVYPHTHDNRAGGGTILLTSNAQELDDWFYLAVSHDGTLNQFTNYIWTKDRYAKSTFIDNIVSPMEPTLHVGRSSSASHMFNGMVDELRIDKVARTEEEILAWYESNSPFWPRGIYRKSY